MGASGDADGRPEAEAEGWGTGKPPNVREKGGGVLARAQQRGRRMSAVEKQKREKLCYGCFSRGLD
jgi:hypothetical protein